MTTVPQRVESSRTPRIASMFAPTLNFVRQLAQRPQSLVGAIIVLLFFLLAIFGPNIAPYPFDEIMSRSARQSPSGEFLFGTDRLGRDVFSRVLWGAREIIGIPGIATIISVFLGTCLGLLLAITVGW